VIQTLRVIEDEALVMPALAAHSSYGKHSISFQGDPCDNEYQIHPVDVSATSIPFQSENVKEHGVLCIFPLQSPQKSGIMAAWNKL
jgi:hypothetical protein